MMLTKESKHKKTKSNREKQKKENRAYYYYYYSARHKCSNRLDNIVFMNCVLFIILHNRTNEIVSKKKKN